jgi:hypothetical protein
MFTAYTSMSDGELGLNTLIRRQGATRFVELSTSHSTTPCRFEIEESAFVIQSDFVGEGTTSFKGRRSGVSTHQVVVKFSWTSDKTSKEVSLLQRATEMQVTGVPHLEAHCLLDHTAGLRQGLNFNQRHRFTIWQRANQNDEGLSQADVNHESKNGYEDLHFRCVVVHPLGVPLGSFQSSAELLRALRDTVKALRSLYFDAKILHRDVSPRNIIISTDSRKSAEQATGLLIDLDMSLDLASEKSAPGTLIGSQGYMAIGILAGDEHTYRHDLESLFYVFLWIAICHNGQSLGDAPPQSRLKSWLGRDWYRVWKTKEKDMLGKEFSVWTDKEFTEAFRGLLPLAKALHQILFPLRHGVPFTGTDIEPHAEHRLYADMIAAFDKHAL